VFDDQGKYLENARVWLEPEKTGGEVRYLQWEGSRGCHLAAGIAAGRYCLIADAPDLDPTKRRVEVEAAGLRTVVVLGSPGLPSRGVHRLGPVVHFDSNESVSCLTDELVVRFRPEATRAQLDELAGRRHLMLLRKLVVAENLFVFRMPGPLCYGMLGVANDIA